MRHIPVFINCVMKLSSLYMNTALSEIFNRMKNIVASLSRPISITFLLLFWSLDIYEYYFKNSIFRL